MRVAVHDQRQHAVVASSLTEAPDLLVYPARLGGGRGADHDQELGTGQFVPDTAAQVRCRGKVFAVTKNGPQPGRNGAERAFVPHQALGDSIAFERPLKPASPGLILVAVTDKRLVVRVVHGASLHAEPPPKGAFALRDWCTIRTKARFGRRYPRQGPWRRICRLNSGSASRGSKPAEILPGHWRCRPGERFDRRFCRQQTVRHLPG